MRRYNLFMILDHPIILATRRNHALEHATLHMLTPHYSERSLAGHSNPTGFFILGDISTTDLNTAVIQALTALRGGQRSLAIHEGCGTNMAVTTLLSAGITYSNPGRLRAGGRGLPVDASWSYERVLRSTKGRVPDTHRVRAQLRMYFGLW